MNMNSQERIFFLIKVKTKCFLNGFFFFCWYIGDMCIILPAHPLTDSVALIKSWLCVYPSTP